MFHCGLGTEARKGFVCLFSVAKMYSRMYLLIHTHITVKKNKESQDRGNSRHSPTQK